MSRQPRARPLPSPSQPPTSPTPVRFMRQRGFYKRDLAFVVYLSVSCALCTAQHSGRGCKILDVGTGTGVLALMMAQKTTAVAAAAAPAASAFLAADATAGIGPPMAAAAGDCQLSGDYSQSGCSSGDGSSSNKRGDGNAGSVRIVAIDVDADACAQAAENVVLSPWADRIRVVHCSLQQLVAAAAAAAAARPPPQAPPKGTVAAVTTPVAAAATSAPQSIESTAARSCGNLFVEEGREGKEPNEPGEASFQHQAEFPAVEDLGPFDLIITNPPYFVESSKPAAGRASARAAARHADVSLPFSDLAAGCAALLAPGGSVCVVLPPTEAQQFVCAAEPCGLQLVDLVRVFTAPEDATERRHLMRLQRAADLRCSLPTVSETGTPSSGFPAASTSTLVINGPKQPYVLPPPPPPPSPLQDLAARSELLNERPPLQARQQQQLREDPRAPDHQVPERVPAEATEEVGRSRRRRAAPPRAMTGPSRRLFTDAYLALTADFHHPAFLQQMMNPAQAVGAEVRAEAAPNAAATAADRIGATFSTTSCISTGTPTHADANVGFIATAAASS
ncbi:hypothetical protein VOLCADRAFT_92112 [Volvox carteri f. nagariensis]|uniref:Type II methyltransferase M.TaqI-like domain-containing protein n=1 Tax=Volvox carteri f. nagariensis TaxID=3068 RepID=D8TYM4_VOLCA|nr:uncharacterized protein VOLCADRAFT_92112 [Volvox carteri f. nagariensis]EFJ47337.1 hypothetical protein VOLCADRAFT_92112 [Volvox carteri f. nagariensis]|eukprot:XP_002951526.1 hypothetical protein VOLCADRAFT_92112 [Volvox carteri f. nagariensis]